MTARHGVYEEDHPEGTPPLVEAGQIPTCPRCGVTGEASRINSPYGTYFCSCGQLFEGTDVEWRRMARVRREAVERRTKMPPAAPAPSSRRGDVGQSHKAGEGG